MSDPSQITGIKKLLMRAKDSTYLAHFRTLLLGAGAGQILSFFLYPIISRIYTPEMYGTVSLVMHVAGIIGCISMGRYNDAIVLPEREGEAKALFKLSAFLLSTTSALVLVVMLVWPVRIATWLGNPEFANLAWMTAAYIFFANGQQIFLFYLNRHQAYGKISFYRVIRAPLNAGLPIVAGLIVKPSAFLLASFQLLGHLIASAYLSWASLKTRKDVGDKEKTGLSDVISAAKKYREFPINSTWVGLQEILSVSLPVLVLTAYFDAAAAGSMAFATNVLRIPSGLVGTAVGQIFYERAARLAKDPKQFRRFVLLNVLGLSLLTAPLLVVMFFFGEPLFVLVFSDKWAMAGRLAEYIAIPVAVFFVSAPLMWVYPVTGRLRLSLIIATLGLVLRAAGLILGAQTGDPVTTVIFYCIGDGTATSISLVTVIMLTLRHAPEELKKD